MHERLTRAVSIMQSRMGVTLRPIDMKRFHEEVELIKSLYNRSWEKNWGFVPMTDHEIDHLAKQFKPVVVPDLIPFAEKDGVPVGFSLAIPDFNVIFRSNRAGPPHALVIIRLLWALKRRSSGAAASCCSASSRSTAATGLDSVLYHAIWTKAAEHGIYWGEAGWILEDNPAMNLGLSKMGFTVYKTLRMYDRPL